MPAPEAFDVVVIGAGPAGVNAAVAAALAGRRVAIAEKAPAVGGAAINTGTVPSKTLRETALALSGLRTRDLYGVDLSMRRQCTVTDLLRHEHAVMTTEQTQTTGLLTGYGISLVHGTARFVDSHTVAVGDDRVLRGESIIIAIGSKPARPDIFPFESPKVHDSDELVNLGEIPKTLAVIGAGVIGSEYACMFAALGVTVHLIDGRDSLLPFLDLEVSQRLAKAMTELGIVFHWKEQVTTCSAPEVGDVCLTLTSGRVLDVGAALVAAGRVSPTEVLNPDAAGLLVGKRGVLSVDDHFRTNVKHIYAVGDVIGFPALASTSAEQGRIAAAHACGDPAVFTMPGIFPTGIYTIPEVGTVGETEGSLKGKGIDYVVGRADYSRSARGKIIGDRSGFLKLLFRRSDLALLGAHAMGEQATELIHLGLMALHTGARAELFRRICFNYPTLADLYTLATHDAWLAAQRRR
ncbi:MAG TPA: Si-specific NAD(P)(+) transhydrogenase [Gemmataceae bacterium]|nr:Si-specific NAD(P)(+) transhydrogenase [Gemmataceae bacterium]